MTTPTRPPINRDKLQEMLLYFIAKGSGDPNLGKTKLMKLLYYADFWRYRDTLRTAISFAPYKKYPQGPLAPTALKLVDRMGRESDRITVELQTRFGHEMSRYSLTEPFRPIHLSSEEIATLDDVWHVWRTATTGEIVDATHSEAPWQSVDFYETIPYEMALML